MTALPALALLRRHALPAACIDAPRPRLAATWFAGEDGRPVCRWIAVGDTADPG